MPTMVRPVLDYAETIDCVDMNHVACVGFSFGGFLMPRVAAFDKRIKLIIADPGNISWGKGIGERLTMIQKMPPKMRPKFMNVMLEDYAWKHGVPEEAVVDEFKKYDNSNILDKVECEVLVLDGTAEMTFGAAKELYDMTARHSAILRWEAMRPVRKSLWIGWRIISDPACRGCEGNNQSINKYNEFCGALNLWSVLRFFCLQRILAWR